MEDYCIPDVVIEMIQERISKIFADYTEAVIKAFAPLADIFANPFGVGELPCSEETDKDSVTRTATSPKKCGLSLLKRPRKTTIHYNYIPRTPKNLPYQRRAF